MQSPHEQCIPGPAPHDPPGCQPLGFVAELLHVAERLGVRAEVEALLLRWAGVRVTVPTPQDRTARLRAEAQKLVDSGVGRQAVQCIVRGRFGISERHARRIVGQAVAIRRQRLSGSQRTMWP